MTTSTYVGTNDQLHRLVFDLLSTFHSRRSSVSSDPHVADVIRQIVAHLVQIFEKRINALKDGQSEDFESESTLLMWTLLQVIARVSNEIDRELVQGLNQHLVALVNKVQAAPVRDPKLVAESEAYWPSFYQLYSQSLQVMHELYSQLENPTPSIEPNLVNFCDQQLRPCMEAFREVCRRHTEAMHTHLRMSQIQRISQSLKMDIEELNAATKFYNQALYTLGLLAARCQGFKYECSNSPSFMFAQPTTIQRMMEFVFVGFDQVVHDSLFSIEPSTSSILVTNNLFSFHCESLCPAVIYKSFDVQIVSEDTANAIQMEMSKVRCGSRSPSEPSTFPSAALLAMKPTSGVKRNNATANAEGGNTAHKKSDVNSKESVSLAPTYNDKSSTWHASYPHLLCTTRQKDAVLLDSRSNQIGKRPLFYFYVKGTAFSPLGCFSYTRTLSPPFTIATRRNQDCQVQRMMSSYTATCFWLYGMCCVDGLVMNWNDSPLPWSRFKQLSTQYFTVNAEVKRPLQDCDFIIFKDKLECDDCREFPTSVVFPERTVTFKNVLCPHFRFETTDNTIMKFSIWRGILEILQIFQEQKANVKTLWDDYLLHGFLDTTSLMNLIQQAHNSSVLVVRLSYIMGGSICVTVRSALGDVVHLEPIDLRKLQTKSIFEYLADIAESAQINYIMTARHELLKVADFVTKYKVRTEVANVKEITSNVSHVGPLMSMQTIKCVPLRVAIVACDGPVLTTSLSPSHLHSTPALNTPQLQTASFDVQLENLMKMYGKTPADVCEMFSYANMTADPFQMSHDYIDPNTYEYC
ncbi:unnamed protein product [Caenorhabditis auriculariae]|uniref:Uncharacterized protein n=1 Tax=Caenorhabditis auriculariae TaxID=2777116 RepID=A0A8S1HNI2_9PELO|nr:unnamed protein product [Caenorhabditis auriculariae]